MSVKTGNTSIIKRTFLKLDENTIDQLRLVADRMTYPPNTTLCYQGKIESTFYIVVDGAVGITQRLDDGSERLLGMIHPNGCFGEMGLVDDSPRIASCITASETTVLEVTEEAFDRFVDERPDFALQIMRRILETARNMDKISIEHLSKRNQELAQAYEDLKTAQAQLVEQERIARELELAAEMQRTLVPKMLPQFENARFAAFLEPANTVGGDFYDVFALDDEHVGFLLADVADKGFHAALFMAVSRTLFVQESKNSLSPAKITTAVHHALFDVSTHENTFVTVFYGVLHRPSGKLTYIRAAQERPLLIPRDGTVTTLAGDGRFLGMLPELTLEEYTIFLQPGDLLVMYSDGVTDAENELKDHYGLDRLKTAVGHLEDRAPQAVVQTIRDDVANWVGTADPIDDFTLLVLEVPSF